MEYLSVWMAGSGSGGGDGDDRGLSANDVMRKKSLGESCEMVVQVYGEVLEDSGELGAAAGAAVLGLDLSSKAILG